MFKLVLLVALFFSSAGFSQTFFDNTKVNKVELYRTVVGTTSAVAIPAASIGGNVLSWKICNDAVNTSTHLFVGKATDAATDGVMLGKGTCLECLNCKGATLQSMRVKGQAASNGYTVIQYRN
jgi:hypothetical protein